MAEGRGLKCPGCGAPLRWTGDVPVLECRYCKTHVVTGTGQKTEQPAVARSAASRAVMWIWIGVVAVLVLSGVSAALVSQGGDGSTGFGLGVPVARLEALSMATTKDQVSSTIGGTSRDGSSITVGLRGCSFDDLMLGWGDKDPSHVVRVSLSTSGGRPNPQAQQLAALLQKQLGKRFHLTEDKRSYGQHWTVASVTLTATGSNLSVHVRPDDDPAWKQRMAALWKVIVATLQGKEAAIDEAAKRDLLGWGRPLESLASIDIRTTLAEAPQAIPKLFPGAQKSTSGGLTFTVAVDHPLIDEVMLSWDNAAQARLGQITLRPFPPVPAALAAARGCLARELGAPSETIDDAANQKKRYDWAVRGLGGVTVPDHAVIVYAHSWFRGPGAPSQQDYARVIRSIATCSASGK